MSSLLKRSWHWSLRALPRGLQSLAIILPVVLVWYELRSAAESYESYTRAFELAALVNGEGDVAGGLRLGFFEAWLVGFDGHGHPFSIATRNVFFALGLAAAALFVGELGGAGSPDESGSGARRSTARQDGSSASGLGSAASFPLASSSLQTDARLSGDLNGAIAQLPSVVAEAMEVALRDNREFLMRFGEYASSETDRQGDYIVGREFADPESVTAAMARLERAINNLVDGLASPSTVPRGQPPNTSGDPAIDLRARSHPASSDADDGFAPPDPFAGIE